MAELIDARQFDSLLEDLDPALVKRAKELYLSGYLTNVTIGNNYLEGRVDCEEGSYPVQIEFGRSRINLYCECDTETSPCVHVLTLLIGYANQAQSQMRDTQPYLGSPRQISAFDLTFPWQPLDRREAQKQIHKQLETLTVPQMRELASRRKVALTGLKRDFVQRTLAEGLAQPENLGPALAALPPDTRRVLDYLGILGESLVNNAPGKRLEIYLDAAQPADKKSRRSGVCLEELRQSGLVFFTDPVYHVPSLSRHLNLPNPNLLPAYAGKLERVDLANPEDFTSLALRLLMLAQAGQLDLEPQPGKLDVGGWKVGVAEERSTSEREVLPQDPYLKPVILEQIARSAGQREEKIDLVAQLLAAGAFWEPRKPSKLSRKFNEWLTLDLGGQMHFLLEVLFTFHCQTELDLARDTSRFNVWRASRGYLRQDQFLAALGVCRWRVLQLLTRLPGETWFPVEDALRLLHGLQPDLIPDLRLRAEARPNQAVYNPGLYLGTGKKPVDLLKFDQWQATYGQFYMQILSTSLHWLGLCDLAWNGKNLAAFRLSAFGEYLLGRRDFPPGAEEKSVRKGLVVSPEGWLEFKPEGADAETATLILLAGEPTGNRKGIVTAPQRLLYRITSRGLGRALEAGWDAARIYTVLERGLRGAIPPSLSEHITRVFQHYGHFHIYTNMALVRFTDDFCLPELLASTRLNRILLHTFSPRLIAIRADAVGDFLEELRAKGHTPRLEGGSDE